MKKIPALVKYHLMCKGVCLSSVNKDFNRLFLEFMENVEKEYAQVAADWLRCIEGMKEVCNN